MLRVLAVDDEVPALEELAYLLRRDPRVGRVDVANDAAQALRGLGHSHQADERLDAVFLDIRMPGLDGLDFARLIAGFSEPPQVVFVTAYDDFAVQAFDLRAVDYLLKPVRTERLADTVHRLVATRCAGRASASPGTARAADDDVSIPIDVGGRTRFVPRAQVRYVQARGDYVRLHTESGNYLVRMSLATLAHRWDAAGFIRIHRSILVSIRHVHELRVESGRTVIDVADTTLPVSRRHTPEVRNRLVRPFYQGVVSAGVVAEYGPDDPWAKMPG